MSGEIMMASRDLITVDKATGEIVNGTPMVVPPKRRNGFGVDWMAMAQDGAMEIAKDPLLKGQDLRVLFALISKLDFENWLRVSQSELAKELAMHQPHIARSMATLADRGILLKGPKVGSFNTYRLNPAFGWKGSAHGHREALRRHREGDEHEG
jgi:hypothetical protein